MKWFRRLFGLGSGEAEKAVEPICVELDQAVTADDAGQVARLLDGGVSPNALVSERNCALGLAALLGHCDCARVLLERGALVDGPAGLLATPLQAAASGLGGLEMVQSLVEHGANLMPNNAQGPVLLCAAEGGDPEVVRYLLDRGAPYAPTDYDPATPLERAVEMSNADAALLLAEVDTTWPALHRAALQGDETKARDLLNRGGNVYAADSQGSTALHAAALGDHVGMIRLLAGYGADLNALDASKATPLHTAALGNCAEAVATLAELGASLELRDCLGSTPLHAAFRAANELVPQVLIAHGADVNAADDERLTALHLCADHADPEFTGWLLAANADLSLRDAEGRTPLLALAANAVPDDEQTQQTLRMLLEHGADPTARDNSGRCVRDWFEAQGCPDLVAILEGKQQTQAC